MIDALSAPGMAIDIRLSTLDAVQQLGPKLANILAGELARLRADSAFTQSIGIATHVSAAHADSLHAQQISDTGNTMLGLTTQTDMHAERAHVAAQIASQTMHRAERHADGRSRADDQPEAKNKDQQAVEDCTVETEPTEIAIALQQSLIQFNLSASEAGYSGTPLAVLLPAKNWVLDHAPADIRQSGDIPSDAGRDSLILCLAFDGSLGRLGIVMGLVFRGDRWIGSVQANWLKSSDVEDENCYSLQVTQPNALLSPVTASDTAGQVKGLRVKIDSSAKELERWVWRVNHWSWN